MFSTMIIRLYIKFGNINALFLATFSEPILFFCQNNEMENGSNLPFEQDIFANFYSLLHCFVWRRFPLLRQEIFPARLANLINKLELMHQFVHRICKSLGKYVLYFKTQDALTSFFI